MQNRINYRFMITVKYIFILAILLFIFASFIIAQQQNYVGFYPYQTCSFSPSADVILSGRIVSSEFVNTQSLRRIAIYKSKVEIEKIFKGSSKKTVEILWGEDATFYDLKKGDERLFIVNAINIDNSNVLLSRKWSRRLNDYTKKEKDNIYFLINSRVKRFPKSPPIVGVVIENKSSPVTQTNKVFTTFGYNYTGFNLVKGITIEAKQKENGKIFRTETNKEGFYMFDKLPDGNYHVYPLFPSGYETVSQAYLDLIYEVATDSCHDLTIFRMNKNNKL